MWEIKGNASNIHEAIIAVYRKENRLKNRFSEHIYSRKSINQDVELIYDKGMFSGIRRSLPTIYGLDRLDINALHDGDVLKLCSDGRVQRLFDITSKSNVLFVTEQCNSHCIMCPQPQRAIDHTKEVLRLLECISEDKLENICISGGEPTVCDDLATILLKLKRYNRSKPIILTNGRKFADFEFTKRIIQCAPRNTVYAIPVYSSIGKNHNQIVGAKDAFKETIYGIYNLTRFKAPIEIRIVITQQNYLQLDEIANFIGWNLPMTIHVAFMGMETVGRADVNSKLVWVEPSEYIGNLRKALKILEYRNIPVSIYNLPLCLLPTELRKYARNSISDWKQGYIAPCLKCSKRNECCGIFTTSKIIPRGLKAFD